MSHGAVYVQSRTYVRTYVPGQLAAGRLPAVPEVVGVRPAVELAVELRVDDRALVPGVGRLRGAVVADPAAAEDVAALGAGQDVAPVAPREPDGERRGGQRESVEQQDGEHGALAQEQHLLQSEEKKSHLSSGAFKPPTEESITRQASRD